jgi:hypothetical protein
MTHLLIYLLLALSAWAGLRVMTKHRVFPLALTALAADGDFPSRPALLGEYPVAAGTIIYEGGIVCVNSSKLAVPGSTATGLIAVGRARSQADNSLGSVGGEINVKVEFGCFAFNNSLSGDLIDLSCVGSSCYIVDDNTVAKTSGTATRSLAGIIVDVDSSYVWVYMSPWVYSNIGLVAANNLSDVSNAATARSHLGANLVALTLRATDLAGADTVIYGTCAPVAGTITKIYWVLKGHALATGNATLTGKINGTAITTGLITITQAGSAIGNKGSVSPSALNVVAAGDEIQFLVGGTNDNSAAFAELTILIAT